MPQPLYHIVNLVKKRDRADGFTLHVPHLRVSRGCRIAITGPSGCGKSTCLDILGLALAPDSAELFDYAGQTGGTGIMDLWRKDRGDALARLRREGIGYIFQSGGLLPYLSVRDNILLTTRMAGMEAKNAEESVTRLAETLEIDGLLDAYPSTLSVGERQRAAIARALAPAPALVLADEPTAALDPSRADEVMHSFMEALANDAGSLILVTHDRRRALDAGLEEARIRRQGSGQGACSVLEFQEGGRP